MATLRKVSGVVETLGDRGFAEPRIVQVNKGQGDLSYIEWHEALRMLDEAFGPFGHDEEIVGSAYVSETGVYTVDLTLTGRAIDDETGEVVTLKRAGRGVGIVPASAINSQPEHDRQAHGAKSDAITNATKGLGDGFGLYLYGKKNKPAQATAQARPAAGQNSRVTPAAPRQLAAPQGQGFRPSPKQLSTLISNGYTEAEVNAMDFDTWKPIMDAIMSTPRGTFSRSAYEGGDELGFDDIPF